MTKLGVSQYKILLKEIHGSMSTFKWIDWLYLSVTQTFEKIIELLLVATDTVLSSIVVFVVSVGLLGFSGD